MPVLALVIVTVTVATAYRSETSAWLLTMRAQFWSVPQYERDGMAPFVEETLEQLRRGVVEQPVSHARWYDYAAALHAHQLDAAAAEAYRRAGMLRPDDPRVPYLLAILAINADGPRTEVIRLFEQSRALDPRYPPLYVREGFVLMDAGRFDEARAAFERAVGLDPAFPMAHRQLGLVLMELDRLEQAQLHLEFAAELVPTDQLTWVGLSKLYQRRGMSERARAASKRAEETEPAMGYRDSVFDDVLARNVGPLKQIERAEALIASGDAAGAVEALLVAEQSLPDDVWIQKHLAAAYEALGDGNRAAHHRSRAAQLDAAGVKAPAQP